VGTIVSEPGLTFSGIVGRLAPLAVATAVVLAEARAPDMDAQVARLIETYRRSSAKPQDIAAKLQAAAEGLAKDAPLRRALHEAAYDYGLKSRLGYATAISAARSLISLDGGRKPDWFEKLAHVESLRYRWATLKNRETAASDYVDSLLRLAAAEESAGQFSDARKQLQRIYRLARAHRMRVAAMMPLRIETLDARQRIERLLGQSQRLLARDPQDARAADALVGIYLRELDRPAMARKHLPDDASEAYRTYVPLACRPVEELNEQQCQELAKWYSELAKTASACGKPRMLARAVGYLERYLKVHPKQDVAHLAAKELLDRAEKQMNEHPWLGVYGELVGFADDEFTLYRNGEKIARSQGNCQPSKPIHIRLMPGDLLCAKLYNMMGPRTFRVGLEAGGVKHWITSGRWRVYEPGDQKRWWQMTPSASDLPCDHMGDGEIWGGKGKDTWVYRALTEQDFAGFATGTPRR